MARRTSGGDRFAAYMDQMTENLGRADGVKVGFLNGATYPDGKSVALIAFIQDRGAPGAGIPPRPFFRNMIAAKEHEWAPALGNLLRENDYNAEVALNIAGAAIEGQLKQSIIDTNSPPLADSTIARKGFSKPLIETSHMINSTGYELTYDT